MNSHSLRKIVIAASLTLFPFGGFAAAPSNASVNGDYAFQIWKSNYDSWSKSVVCQYAEGTITFSGRGQAVSTQLIFGTVSFDGNGHLTSNYTAVHKFDQAASNNTVSITCPDKYGGTPTINSGQVVFEAPETGTFTGTYSVSSSGSGSMTINGSGINGPVTMEFDLGAFTGSDVSTTLLLRSDPSSDDTSTGVAVLK